MHEQTLIASLAAITISLSSSSSSDIGVLPRVCECGGGKKTDAHKNKRGRKERVKMCMRYVKNLPTLLSLSLPPLPFPFIDISHPVS